MSTRPRRPLRRRLQARAMRVVNVPMRRALGLPFATPLSSRLMLVFLSGRRTGRSYRQPLSYVRQGDTLLTPGGGTWKRNLVEGRPVRIRLRGRDVLAVPELVGDVDAVGRLLGVMAAANPRIRAFVGISATADGGFDRDQLERAVHHGFRVVRWQVTGAHAGEPVAAGAERART